MSDWEDEQLDELRHHWSSAYVIARIGSKWVAQRRDHSRASFSADSADGLLERIRIDYAADPVPRSDAP